MQPSSCSQAELPTELKVEDGVKIGFSLCSSAKSNRGSLKRKGIGGGKSTLDELMREEEKKKKINRKDYWLHEGIVFKVMTKALADKGYYKQKGVVLNVIDKWVGEIKKLDSKHVLRVDQAELQTVIPQIGAPVKIVNGAYRGSTARLLEVDIDHFCAKVQIKEGPYVGRILQEAKYEHISKITQ